MYFFLMSPGMRSSMENAVMNWDAPDKSRQFRNCRTNHRKHEMQNEVNHRCKHSRKMNKDFVSVAANQTFGKKIRGDEEA
jgi:hypothetical protein